MVLFCFSFVQRDLLKQIPLKKNACSNEPRCTLKSGLLQVQVVELLSLGADIDQFRINPFFRPE